MRWYESEDDFRRVWTAYQLLLDIASLLQDQTNLYILCVIFCLCP